MAAVAKACCWATQPRDHYQNELFSYLLVQSCVSFWEKNPPFDWDPSDIWLTAFNTDGQLCCQTLLPNFVAKLLSRLPNIISCVRLFSSHSSLQNRRIFSFFFFCAVFTQGWASVTCTCSQPFCPWLLGPAHCTLIGSHWGTTQVRSVPV